MTALEKAEQELKQAAITFRNLHRHDTCEIGRAYRFQQRTLHA